jgi:hypothetical protein
MQSTNDVAETTRLTGVFEKLRERLLDRTSRNPLVSYKHRPTSKRQLRIVDTQLESVYEQLTSGQTNAALAISPLPEPEEVPEDERSPEFRSRLEYAKASDEAFLTKGATIAT